jgi:hypothetical protein
VISLSKSFICTSKPLHLLFLAPFKKLLLIKLCPRRSGTTKRLVILTHIKSPRLSAKDLEGKTVLKLAQDPIAKRCGIVPNEESLDDTTLQRYLDMYKKPLPRTFMQAILKLSEVASEKKKKKKGKGTKEKEKKKVQPSRSKMFEASRKMISNKKTQKSKEKAPLGAEA